MRCEHVFVHHASLRQFALDLVADGVNDCEIARRLDVSRTTVRDWRRPRYVPRGDRERAICPRCWRRTPRIAFSDSDYAELLGLYLGDGHIAAMARTEFLRISLDAKYPTMNDEIEALLRRCFPDNRVGRTLFDGGSTVVLHVYSRHLSCLFPQAGPGKKHERAIVLEPWQAQRVAAAPWAFLRGCIRSDGCAFVNRTGTYEYLSYDFCNSSDEIRQLFVDACRHLGLACRPAGNRVRINRRESVAQLLEHVGVKS
jgi:transposase-like protein